MGRNREGQGDRSMNPPEPTWRTDDGPRCQWCHVFRFAAIILAGAVVVHFIVKFW